MTKLLLLSTATFCLGAVTTMANADELIINTDTGVDVSKIEQQIDMKADMLADAGMTSNSTMSLYSDNESETGTDGAADVDASGGVLVESTTTTTTMTDENQPVDTSSDVTTGTSMEVGTDIDSNVSVGGASVGVDAGGSTSTSLGTSVGIGR